MTEAEITAHLAELARRFDPITLSEMKSVRLMNRIDTKYVVAVQRLPALLEALHSDYRIQTLDDDLRLASYSTLYFDTPACDLYLMHHNGRAVRQKVRIRRYDSSRLQFLEVKNKNNKGRTAKVRTELDAAAAAVVQDRLAEPALQFLHSHDCFMPPESLVPWLYNRFLRLTLVNRSLSERLTIDVGLHFLNRRTTRTADLSAFAIIELKRSGLLPSPAAGILLAHRVRPCGFSKYCIGLLLTTPGLKAHRFLPKLRHLRKIIHLNTTLTSCSTLCFS